MCTSSHIYESKIVHAMNNFVSIIRHEKLAKNRGPLMLCFKVDNIAPHWFWFIKFMYVQSAVVGIMVQGAKDNDTTGPSIPYLNIATTQQVFQSLIQWAAQSVSIDSITSMTLQCYSFKSDTNVGFWRAVPTNLFFETPLLLDKSVRHSKMAKPASSKVPPFGLALKPSVGQKKLWSVVKKEVSSDRDTGSPESIEGDPRKLNSDNELIVTDDIDSSEGTADGSDDEPPVVGPPVDPSPPYVPPVGLVGYNKASSAQTTCFQCGHGIGKGDWRFDYRIKPTKNMVTSKGSICIAFPHCQSIRYIMTVAKFVNGLEQLA